MLEVRPMGKMEKAALRRASAAQARADAALERAHETDRLIRELRRDRDIWKERADAVLAQMEALVARGPVRVEEALAQTDKRPSSRTDCGGDADLLHGSAQIAEYLGLRKRQVEGMIASKKLPTFKMVKAVCATKSGLTDFMAKKQAAAMEAARG